jgi:4-oxalocrotonate tautomerase
MALSQAKLIEGVFASPHKQQIVERLTDPMVEIQGENSRNATGCVIEEVARGEWGVGGQTLTADDVKALARGWVGAMISKAERLPRDRSRSFRCGPLAGSGPEPCQTAARRPVTRQLFDDDALPTGKAGAVTTKVASMRAAEVEHAQQSRRYRLWARRAEQVRSATAHPASASAIGDARTW